MSPGVDRAEAAAEAERGGVAGVIEERHHVDFHVRYVAGASIYSKSFAVVDVAEVDVVGRDFEERSLHFGQRRRIGRQVRCHQRHRARFELGEGEVGAVLRVIRVEDLLREIQQHRSLAVGAAQQRCFVGAGGERLLAELDDGRLECGDSRAHRDALDAAVPVVFVAGATDRWDLQPDTEADLEADLGDDVEVARDQTELHVVVGGSYCHRRVVEIRAGRDVDRIATCEGVGGWDDHRHFGRSVDADVGRADRVDLVVASDLALHSDREGRRHADVREVAGAVGEVDDLARDADADIVEHGHDERGLQGSLIGLLQSAVVDGASVLDATRRADVGARVELDPGLGDLQAHRVGQSRGLAALLRNRRRSGQADQ